MISEGNILGVDEDDIFKKRIRKRGAKLTEFKKAIITIAGAKEKIEIIFREEKFTGELMH